MHASLKGLHGVSANTHPRIFAYMTLAHLRQVRRAFYVLLGSLTRRYRASLSTLSAGRWPISEFIILVFGASMSFLFCPSARPHHAKPCTGWVRPAVVRALRVILQLVCSPTFCRPVVMSKPISENILELHEKLSKLGASVCSKTI